MSSASLFPDFVPRPKVRRRPRGQMVRSLLRLHDAVQRINSILDLDLLLDKVVNEVAAAFGCVEAMVLLKDDESDEVCVAAVKGCTQCAKHDRFRIAVDGLVGWVAATGHSCYTPDVSKESRYLACEQTTRSEFDVPLIAHGKLIGVFSAQHPEIDGFPAEQRTLLEALAGHIAVAVANARVFRREAAERAEARAIQQGLFPKVRPEVPGFSVEGLCVPAGAVGGDWYDFMPLAPRHGGEPPRWGLVLADVSGKGMAAALLMSATRALLRSVAESIASPAEVLTRLNRMLLRELPAEKFVTMVYAILDPVKHTITFANAGHPLPILANGAKTTLLQTASGLPLGVLDGAYDERTIKLPPGSRLVLYSDGVTEAGLCVNAEFGMERLTGYAKQRAVTASSILEEVSRYCSGQALCDDATVIVVTAD